MFDCSRPDSWSGVLDGTKHSASPQQDLEPIKELRNFLPMPINDVSEELSEDCLYLSIYTATTSKTANLPVNKLILYLKSIQLHQY